MAIVLLSMSYNKYRYLVMFMLLCVANVALNYTALSQCLPSRASKHMTCCKGGRAYGVMKSANHSSGRLLPFPEEETLL